MSHALTRDPKLLLQHLQWQQELIPYAVVHIQGTHTVPGSSFPVPDFDLTISLRHCLNREGRFRIVLNL